jgi:hypothetical protein
MKRVTLPVLMTACLAGAVSLRGPLGEANAGRRLPGTGYVPKPRLAKLLSFGHRSTAADLLWLSAIGDLSRDFGDPQRKLRWLDTVFDAIGTLEPSFSTVYSFGATFFTIIAPDYDRAVELLERGVARNPGDIKLAIELAMAYYMNRNDREAAKRVLARIVQDPRCDSITIGFYTSMLVDEREDFAALAQWQAWREHPNDVVRDMAELQQERAKRRIALRALDEFRLAQGRPARTRDELRGHGLMAPEVVDVVLDALWIDVACRPVFLRLEELERRHQLRGAKRWVLLFRNEKGRMPTVDELYDHHVLAPPPPGHHYEIVGDDVTIVADGAAEE